MLLQFDTKGTHADSPLNQFYRDMHGYIVMCDVVNMVSMRDVPKQLKTIYDRTHIKDPVVTVFVNKVEVLDDRSNSESSLMTSNRKFETHGTAFSIQEEALTNLEKLLTKNYPQVKMYEISLRIGLNVTKSMMNMGCQLESNSDNYIRQQFKKNMQRQSNYQKMEMSYRSQDKAQRRMTTGSGNRLTTDLSVIIDMSRKSEG